MKYKEGAFNVYADSEVELVGFTTCNGCPGGNIEYAGEEMVKNGAEVIHLATGMVVGYNPKIANSWPLFRTGGDGKCTQIIASRLPIAGCTPCQPG